MSADFIELMYKSYTLFTSILVGLIGSFTLSDFISAVIVSGLNVIFVALRLFTPSYTFSVLS